MANNEVRKEVETIKAETSEALTISKGFHISTPEQFTAAGEIVKVVKAKWKEIDDRRKEITVPLNAAVKSVNDLFRDPLNQLLEAERVLKLAIASYTNAREQQRVEAMQASAALYQAGGTPTALIPEPAKAEGISVRYRWLYEIVNPEAVPRQFCSPDDAKIKARVALADTEKPPLHIDGVRFFLDTTVTVRQ